MNRRTFFASIVALLPVGWFKGKKKTIHERLSEADPCPWCGGCCMFIESEKFGSAAGCIRIAADCDEHWEKFAGPENDTTGNDYGRTNWCPTIEEAIAEWNKTVRLGCKTNQRGVW